jgi:hypothetical protein
MVVFDPGSGHQVPMQLLAIAPTSFAEWDFAANPDFSTNILFTSPPLSS